MKHFRVFELPTIPRERALKFLDPIELFELSLCSSKVAHSVKSLRIGAKSHHIVLTKGQSSVYVTFNKKNTIWWDFKSYFLKKDLSQQRTIGNIFFEFCEKTCSGGSMTNSLPCDEFYCDYEKVEEGAAVVSKHFQFLFSGPLQIIISPEHIESPEPLFSVSQIEKCETLELCGGFMPNRKTMEHILKKLEIEKELSIRHSTIQNYVIEQALQVEKLFLQSAHWMTRDHLLKLNCQIVVLKDNSFKCEDLEAFAANWLENKDSRLERITFDWDPNMEFRLENLKTGRWDSSKRERHFIYYEKTVLIRVDCSKGFELERDDGMLATFVLERKEDCEYLHFFVWREAYPEMKRLEQLPEELAQYYDQLEKINKHYPDTSSLERALSNSNLTFIEFVDTYRIMKNMDLESRVISVGRAGRRSVFDKMFATINLQMN